MLHESFVDLEGFEDGSALGGFVLLAHAVTGVGVDGVGSGGGLDGVVGEGERAAGGFSDTDGLVDDVELGFEALGCRNGDVCAELCAGAAPFTTKLDPGSVWKVAPTLRLIL